MPSYSPSRMPNLAVIRWYLRGLKLRMARSRVTTRERVGVCTRPTVAICRLFPLLFLRVTTRVPLMPISQSDSDRQRAASCKGCISSPGLSCL